MKFLNFTLNEPTEAFMLNGCGYDWDLHNFAQFRSLTFLPADSSVELEWKVPEVENPWGCPANKATACRLVFRGVKLLSVCDGDDDLPDEEGQTLHGVSQVVPERDRAPRFRSKWSSQEPFNLLFHFQNGRDIEIDSETVELIPL